MSKIEEKIYDTSAARSEKGERKMKVSITQLPDYAMVMDARPLPSDRFTVTLTRSHLEWLREVVRQQVLTEQKQMEHYIKRDAAKHPERMTIDKFKHRLEIAQDFAHAIDKARKEGEV